MPASKTYGDADPSPLTTGSGDFLAADGVTATYSRDGGRDGAAVLSHHGDAESGSGARATTSSPTLVPKFTINKRKATWTTNRNSKTYGDVDPTPLTTGSGATSWRRTG